MKKTSFIEDLPFAPEVRAFWSRLRLPSKKGLSIWFRRNGLVAVLAFVVSVFLYLALQEKVTKKVFKVKVVVRDSEDVSGYSWWHSPLHQADAKTPRTTEVFAATPAFVNVTLAGTLSELQLLDDSKLEIIIPDGAIKTNSLGKPFSARIRNHHVRGEGNLNVSRIEPDTIGITSDSQVRRMFQIAMPKMDIIRPLNGHPEIKVEPNQAEVEGWASQLDDLARSGAMLKLETIQVDGKHASFQQEVEVFPPDSKDSHPMTVTPSRVSVTVNIVPDTMERVVSNLMVKAVVPSGCAFPSGYLLSQTNVAVSLIGEKSSLADPALHEKIGVFLDLPASTNGTAHLSVLMSPGVQVSSARAIPETIDLIPPPPRVIPTNPPTVRPETSRKGPMGFFRGLLGADGKEEASDVEPGPDAHTNDLIRAESSTNGPSASIPSETGEGERSADDPA